MIGKNLTLVIVILLICSSISAASVKQLGSGFHGFISILEDEANNVTYILKDAKFGNDLNIRRELYFGQKLSSAESITGKDNVARFVKHVKEGNKLQLQFIYEGAQLDKLLFQFDAVESMFKPTAWLTWLGNTTEGQQVMRNLFHQMLLGVKFCHDNGVIHRDIKPANLVICFEKTNGSCGMVTPLHTNEVHLRIIDFGSAVDSFARENLYGKMGPVWDEQDIFTMPPEAIIDQSWSTYSLTPKYDSWSVGHIMLGFILGTPEVFSFKDFASVEMLRHYQTDHIDFSTSRLAGMAEYCIGLPDAVHIEKMEMLPTCNEDGYVDYIRNQTPFKFIDMELLKLIRLLLEADPDMRIGVDEALQHPYFFDSDMHIGVDEVLPHPYIADTTYISLYYYAIAFAFVIVTCICYGMKKNSKKKEK